MKLNGTYLLCWIRIFKGTITFLEEVALGKIAILSLIIWKGAKKGLHFSSRQEGSAHIFAHLNATGLVTFEK